MSKLTHKILLCSTTLLFALGAKAENLALPARLPIDKTTVSTLSLLLDQAVIEIEVDDAATPSLTAAAIAAESPSEALRIETRDHSLSIRRGANESAPRPIRLRLVLGSEQTLEISGRALELDLQAPIEEATRDEATHEVAKGEDETERATSEENLEQQFDGLSWRYHLRLEDSAAELEGVVATRLEVKGSEVRLRATSGPLLLDSEDSTIESEDHRGQIRVLSAASKVEIERQLGGLLFETDGGELTVIAGHGPYQGDAAGALVSLLDWQGSAKLDGEGARFEVRDGYAGCEIEIAGRDLDIDVVRLEGALTADVEGGRLNGTALYGRTVVAARKEAQLALADLGGELVDIQLTEGASADLSGVDSVLEVKLDRARAEVTGARQLGVKGVQAEMVAEAIESVRMISLKNSLFDLDLTSLERHPAMALRGASEGRLLLAQPCVVRLAGKIELVDANARVTGCDLVTLASPKAERMRGQRGYPEGTIVLVTNLEEGGKIEVKGVVVP